MSYFSNDANRIEFPPAGTGPYFIDLDWCMGDSLQYINKNNEIFAQRTVDLSSFFIAISSFNVSLSGKDTSTIQLDYNFRANALSAFVVNGSITTTQLGGNIGPLGKALLTAAGLSGLKDVKFTTSILNNQALVYNSSTELWENKSVADISLASLLGDRGDVTVTQDQFNRVIFTIDESATNDSLRAITTNKIKDGAITYTKLAFNTVTTPSLYWTGTSAAVGTNDATQSKFTVARPITWPPTSNTSCILITNPIYSGEIKALDMGITPNGGIFINAFGGNATNTVVKTGHLYLNSNNVGNVGVGVASTTSLTSKLQVNGSIAATGLTLGSGNISTTGSVSFGGITATGITATGITVNGNASITGTITGTLNNTLTRGTYLLGNNFNNSSNVTWSVDATTTNTAGKIVARDSNGDINARIVNATDVAVSHAIANRSSDTVFFSSTSNAILKNSATGFRASLDVPTRTGGGASGTWGINVTGNAATVTNGVYTSRNISTDGGLTGGGNLTADRTLSIADQGVTTAKLSRATRIVYISNNNYTITAADAHSFVVMYDETTNRVINVPLGTGLPEGFTLSFFRGSTGQVTFNPTGGARLFSADNLRSLAAPNSVATLLYSTTYGGTGGGWFLFGDLV
jgi:hypothetical protein